jgi:hypothetical protein
MAEAVASVCASAASYGGPEDVGVMAIIVAELEFGDIKRQIFFADLMKGADHAALDQRPKAPQSCWCEPRRPHIRPLNDRLFRGGIAFKRP